MRGLQRIVIANTATISSVELSKIRAQMAAYERAMHRVRLERQRAVQRADAARSANDDGDKHGPAADDANATPDPTQQLEHQTTQQDEARALNNADTAGWANYQQWMAHVVGEAVISLLTVPRTYLFRERGTIGSAAHKANLKRQLGGDLSRRPDAQAQQQTADGEGDELQPLTEEELRSPSRATPLTLCTLSPAAGRGKARRRS